MISVSDAIIANHFAQQIVRLPEPVSYQAFPNENSNTNGGNALAILSSFRQQINGGDEAFA